jgi:hypothetical protein
VSGSGPVGRVTRWLLVVILVGSFGRFSQAVPKVGPHSF